MRPFDRVCTKIMYPPVAGLNSISKRIISRPRIASRALSLDPGAVSAKCLGATDASINNFELFQLSKYSRIYIEEERREGDGIILRILFHKVILEPKLESDPSYTKRMVTVFFLRCSLSKRVLYVTTDSSIIKDDP